jgi:hypothetical protein
MARATVMDRVTPADMATAICLIGMHPHTAMKVVKDTAMVTDTVMAVDIVIGGMTTDKLSSGICAPAYRLPNTRRACESRSFRGERLSFFFLTVNIPEIMTISSVDSGFRPAIY